MTVAGVTAFGNNGVELHMSVTVAATLRQCSPPLLAVELFQRVDQERSLPAFHPISGIEPPFLDQVAEEFLREVLRIVGRLTTTADVGIERIPIGAADGFQRRTRFRR